MILSTKGLVFVAFYAVLLQVTVCSDWKYQGEDGAPAEWQKDYPECGGLFQSPINIVTKDAVIDPTIHMLKLPGYGQNLNGGTFVNNGHSIQLNFPPNTKFQMSGGGLGNNTYRALQLHFHWCPIGSTDGSEHTVDGKHYPAEMHIVHIKEPYTTTEQVKGMRDGLAVLGVFFELGTTINLPLQKLLNTASRLTYSGSTATLVDGPSLINLLPNSATFYRYLGSLTTPPCYETVAWTVFANSISISRSQLLALQRLQSTEDNGADGEADTACSGGNCTFANPENGLGGNYRPVQPPDGRVVTSFVDFSKFTIMKFEPAASICNMSILSGYKKVKDHDWTYYGQLDGSSHWPDHYGTCGKTSQSPINIDSKTAVEPVVNQQLEFSGYGENLKGTFVNNGHAVQLNLDSNLNYVVTGGGTGSSYTAVQLHFHWGEILSDKKINGGSEHTANDKRYAAEMHIVHGKTSHLSDLSQYRETASDAYMVLGIFIDVYQNETAMDNDAGANENMQALIDVMTDVTYAGDSLDLTSGPVLASILPKSKSFFRYNGSLTTPPCTESVIWTVFEEPIQLSFNQFAILEHLFLSKKADVWKRESIKKLKEAALVESLVNNNISESATDNRKNEETEGSVLLDGTAQHLLRNNFRPLQGLNSRQVTFYKAESQPTMTDPTPQETSVLVIVLGIVFGLIVFVILALVAKRCWCDKRKKGGDVPYTAGQQKEEI